MNDRAITGAAGASDHRAAPVTAAAAGAMAVTREMFDRLIVPCYSPASFVPVRGEGSRVWDQDGRMYIDFASGVAVTALGHCHPTMVRALTEQAHRLWHVSNWFTNEPALRLARKLVDATFADRVFFCNSGAEANEAALKLARRYAHDRFGADKHKVVAASNAFHGRTLFTVTVGGQPKYSSGFGPNPGGVVHVPFNDTAALAEAVDDSTCAVILEPMQGEGGMVPGRSDYLQEARRICDRHRALLVLDEIQSGMGRTGALFSYMQKGIVPDILTTAKGLGGGFPIGAMLAREDVAQAFSVGVHGTTYGGNPLACAVAEAVFDTINTAETLDGVKTRHRIFVEGLKALNARVGMFSDIRGEGVWLGCELVEPFRGRAMDVVTRGHAEGVLTLVAGPDVVRIAPALNVSIDDIVEGLGRLEKAVASLRAGA